MNWFLTLNAALESEGLIETWNCCWPKIKRGETRSYTFEDGTKYGHFITIYRDETGRYERPIHYARG